MALDANAREDISFEIAKLSIPTTNERQESGGVVWRRCATLAQAKSDPKSASKYSIQLQIVPWDSCPEILIAIVFQKSP
jgi:hypothetical protein